MYHVRYKNSWMKSSIERNMCRYAVETSVYIVYLSGFQNACKTQFLMTQWQQWVLKGFRLELQRSQLAIKREKERKQPNGRNGREQYTGPVPASFIVLTFRRLLYSVFCTFITCVTLWYSFLLLECSKYVTFQVWDFLQPRKHCSFPTVNFLLSHHQDQW